MSADSALTAIVVRGYEMRRGGAAPVAVVARYFEHARWDALRDGTLGVQRFLGRGVVRAQWLQIEAAFGYGTSIEVETWLSHVGRTSFQLAHVARRVDDGVVLARGTCTLVALGDQGPQPLPAEARALPVREPPARPRGLEAWPEPTAATSEREILVGRGDEDVFGHVNQARYVELADDARWHASHMGQIAASYGESPARTVWVEHLREVHAGERVRLLVATSSSIVAVTIVAPGGEACRVALGNAVAISPGSPT